MSETRTPPRRRVLVVDDSRDAALLLGKVIELLGNEVRLAGDGQEAIDVATEFRPDAIFMDLGMPMLNGYEAAQIIRQQEWGQNVLLVALTGWGQDDDRRRTKEAGFNHHLVKPVELTAVQQLFADLDAASS
jgi:CheY-like chemotaxis protein